MAEKKVPAILICFCILFAGLLSATTAEADSEKVKITTSNLNVREGPGTSYPVINKVNTGESYYVIKQVEEWLQIRLGSGKHGWIAKEYTAKPSSATATVTANLLRVREGPGTSYPAIASIQNGEQIDVIEVNQNWVKTTEGWVAKEFIEIENSKPAQSSPTITNEPLGQAIVTADSLNIRDEAGLAGTIIGKVAKGQSFKILAEENNWYKIEFSPGKTGWAASWFFSKHHVQAGSDLFSASGMKETVMILTDGTNIRSEPNTRSAIIQTAYEGDRFEVIGRIGDWHQIKLDGDVTGYIADWVVSISGNVDQTTKTVQSSTKMKTVVIDPGHGGKDVGTIGASGTLEKTLTLQTAKLLAAKLRDAGVKVYLTRDSDTYLTLGSRVSMAHFRNADAFISLHYDSTFDDAVSGITSYYYHDDRLATKLQAELVPRTGLSDREARFGDYYVLRENNQMSALLELGYLSNPAEERLVTSDSYQETVATAIFEGLMRYFEVH